jgi:peptide/nickel transport system permease protein
VVWLLRLALTVATAAASHPVTAAVGYQSGAGMWRFLIRRVFWAIFLVFAVTVVTYAIFFLLPTDPARLAAGRGASLDSIERVRRLLHLDEPVWKQYGRFVWNLIAHQSLGTSFINRASVKTMIENGLPVTASLVVGGAILYLTVSIPIGILSAVRPRSLFDRVSMIFVLVGMSTHPVWLGLTLSWLFGYKLGITPIAGYCNAFPGPSYECNGALQWAYHMILPWITFSVLFAALYVRMIRALLLEALNEDYVRTARAKGASERRVILHHAVRNSMLPVVTILGMDTGLAFVGAIFVESVFDLPGVGRQLVIASNQLDLPMICGIVVFTAFIVIALNLVVDIAYGILDPRIRLTDPVRLG